MTKLRNLARIRFGRFFFADRGIAAAEFGLLLPVFALSLLAMIDVGLAINERMNLDRVLRSGAQLAMSGVQDVDALENAVVSSGAGNNEDGTAPSVDSLDYSISVTRTCECGGAAGSCTQRCGSGEPPSLFYNFRAWQTMDTMMLPQFDVESNLRVQVR